MYDEALRQDRNNALLYLKISLARTLLTPPQLDQALQDVASAIQINPSMGQAWRQQGDIHMRRGDLGAAEDSLIQAAGMLQGWERVQAQQSLADARSRRANQTPPAPPPTVANEPLPSTQAQGSPTSPPNTILPASHPSTHLTPPATHSPQSLSPQTPATGIACMCLLA